MSLMTEDTVVKEWRRRIFTDTGFVCRNICGFDYDEDHLTKEKVRPGGVRDTGAHRQIVDMIDDPKTRYKLILTPRLSYKSSILQGYVIRRILRDPNVRILYIMKDAEKAAKKAFAIRSVLESEKVTKLFGEQRGPVWQAEKFTVAGRTFTNLQEPTFSTATLNAPPTGGHYDVIAVDDLIDHTNYQTADAMEKARMMRNMLAPLCTPGTVTIYAGTRYHHEDIYSDLQNNPNYHPPFGQIIDLGAGVDVVQRDHGLHVVESADGLTFPHLTVPMLQHLLNDMKTGSDYYLFSCQFLNVVPTSINSPFRRERFRYTRWQEKFGGYTGYLLTDTATSLKQDGCHSVLAYCLLDQDDNLYLLSLQIGHWRPDEFVRRFFDLLDKWQHRVNHAGEVWEETAFTAVFQDVLRVDERVQRIKTNKILLPRLTEDSKHRRIMRLEQVFARDQFHVVDTIDRTYEELDGKRLLYDPEAFRRGQFPLPDGELVRQFVEYRPSDKKAKKDICDTLAMLYEPDRKSGGRRFCRYRSWRVLPSAPDRLVALPSPGSNASLPQDSAKPTSWWDRQTLPATKWN